MEKTASVWRNKDFLWLFSGRTISQLGTSITTFTISWLLLELTGSAVQTGISFVVGFVPYLLLSLPAGVWADKYNRKKIMIIADSGRLFLLMTIPAVHFLNGEIPVLLLYIVQAGISLFSAFFDAAYGACLPNIIERSQLQEGNAVLQTGSSISQIGGPILAGVIVSIFGTANTLLIDVASYLFSIITIFFINNTFSGSLNTKVKTNMFADIHEGIRYVWDIKVLRILALLSMLVNLVGPGMDIALIYRIKSELHLSSNWAGIILAGVGCGMIIGSFVTGRMKKRYQMGTLLTISMIGLVIPPFILTLAINPMVMLLSLFITGFMLVLWSIQVTTLRQSITPDHLLGRCISIFRLMVWISVPIGAAMAGVITEAWGASIFFLFAGCTLSVVCLIFLMQKMYAVNEFEVKYAEYKEVELHQNT